MGQRPPESTGPATGVYRPPGRSLADPLPARARRAGCGRSRAIIWAKSSAPLRLDDLRTDLQLCGLLEAHIIVAEYSVHRLIHERARQLAGLPLHLHAAPRPLHDVSAGLSRLAKPFGNLDRLAHRRAERMRLELNARACPCRSFASIHLSQSSTGEGKPTFFAQLSDCLHQCAALAGSTRSVFAQRRRGPCAIPRPPSRQSKNNFARAWLIEHQRGRGRLSELI